MSRLFIAFIMALCLPLIARAQPLADRVPADSLVYIGWQGSKSLGPAYERSRLKAVLDNCDFPALVKEYVPQLARLSGGFAAPEARLLAIAGLLWRHPTALYFRGIDPDTPQRLPLPKVALICQAGNDSPALLAALRDLAAMMPAGVRIFQLGDLVGIEAGFEQEAMAVAGDGPGQPKSITTSDPFRQAMTQVGKAPALCVYGDLEALVRLIDAMAGTPDWGNVRTALGLGSLRRLAITAGFDDRDWTTQFFLNAPAPRAGLLALLDVKPLSEDACRLIPSTATWACATKLDMGRILSQVRAIAGKINPDAQREFDRVMAEARQEIGFDIQTDLLNSLGDEWVAYSDPATGGAGPLGMVAVNRLAKPEQAQQAIAKLTRWLTSMADQEMRRGGPRFAFGTTRVGDVEINYLSMPAVRPSWAFKDGNLYVALYPQILAAAMQKPVGKSILDNEDFLTVRKRCAARNVVAFSFDDLPRTAGDSYQLMLFLSHTLLGFADMTMEPNQRKIPRPEPPRMDPMRERDAALPMEPARNVPPAWGALKMPAMILPPLPKLRENVTPAGTFAWVDDAGLHIQGITPFPGAELVAGQGQALAGPAAIAAGATYFWIRQSGFRKADAAEGEPRVADDEEISVMPGDVEVAPGVSILVQAMFKRGAGRVELSYRTEGGKWTVVPMRQNPANPLRFSATIPNITASTIYRVERDAERSGIYKIRIGGDRPEKAPRQPAAEPPAERGDAPAAADFKQTKEWKALNRLVGTWEEEATVTVPQPSKARVSIATTWVLGDRFLQSRSRSDLDRSESMSLYTWDQNRRVLRAWWFHSMGFSAAFTGSWDDASSTFTFKVDDIAPSLSTVTNHLIDDDHYEWKVITKDPDGRVVYEMSGKATRQKPGKAAGEAAPPKTAAETIGRIFELLKAGDFDAAAEYFHPAGDRRRDIKEELRRAVTRIGEGGFSVTAADSKEDGDLAVVIVKVVENRKPDDAVVGYEINRMVRTDGIWRIYENIDDAKLDGTAREKMDALWKWAKGRQRELGKEMLKPAAAEPPENAAEANEGTSEMGREAERGVGKGRAASPDPCGGAERPVATAINWSIGKTGVSAKTEIRE